MNLTPLPNISGSHDWPLTNEQNHPPKFESTDKMWPKITIVTPSYNQGCYLEKTIRSVLLQGYPNLEYIIIDGGSTDQSVEILKKYAPWVDFWVSEKDRGQSHAINKGFERATGELLGWLNSDDYFLPGALIKVALAYLENPTVGAIAGIGYVVNTKGKVIYTPEFKPINRESIFNWFYGNNFMQPSCLFTHKAWNECGPIDESIHIAMDVDLWIRIADKFAFRSLNESISVALEHPDAKTTAQKERMYVDLAMVYIKYGEHIHARRILNDLADRLCRYQKIADTAQKFWVPLWRVLVFLRILKP